MDPFLGGSPAIVGLRKALPALARDSSPLIIVGERGTGKTLYAEHIHARSPMGAEKLKVLNFSVLPERGQHIGLLGAGVPDVASPRRSILQFPTTAILKYIDNAGFYLQDQLMDALRHELF